MAELYIPLNGQFYPRTIPFNKGKKWDEWMGEIHRERIKSNLQLGRKKGNASMAGWNAKVVIMLKDGKIIGAFKSCLEAGRKTGIQSRNICAVCHKKRKRAGGFEWSFEIDLLKNKSESYRKLR